MDENYRVLKAIIIGEIMLAVFIQSFDKKYHVKWWLKQLEFEKQQKLKNNETNP